MDEKGQEWSNDRRLGGKASNSFNTWLLQPWGVQKYSYVFKHSHIFWNISSKQKYYLISIFFKHRNFADVITPSIFFTTVSDPNVQPRCFAPSYTTWMCSSTVCTDLGRGVVVTVQLWVMAITCLTCVCLCENDIYIYIYYIYIYCIYNNNDNNNNIDNIDNIDNIS